MRPMKVYFTIYLFATILTSKNSRDDINLMRDEEEDGVGDLPQEYENGPNPTNHGGQKSGGSSQSVGSKSDGATGGSMIPKEVDPQLLEIVKAGGIRGFYTRDEMESLLKSPNPSMFCRHQVDPVNIWKDKARKEPNLIGKGSFGRVYRGVYTDQRSKPPKDYEVAVKYVKYLKRTMLSILKEINFMRLMKISRHHLPFYQCYFERSSERQHQEDKDDQVILMIALMNGDVDSVVRKPDKRSEFLRKVKYENFLVDMAKGIRDMHWMGVLHRDIKPDNFLINKYNSPIVADLGLSEFCGADGISGLAGTPYFMAPEVVERKRYSYPSDVYSLGVTFACFLTASSPQNFVDFQLPEKDKTGRAQVFYHKLVGSRYIGLVQAMTHPDPAKRPTMVDVVNDLTTIASGRPSKYPAQPAPRPPGALGLGRALYQVETLRSNHINI